MQLRLCCRNHFLLAQSVSSCTQKVTTRWQCHSKTPRNCLSFTLAVVDLQSVVRVKPASTGARTVIWSPKAANRKRTSTVGSRTLWPRRIARPLRSISGTGRGPPRHVGGSPVVASKVPRHRSYHEKKCTGISDSFMMVDLSKIKSYSVHRYAQSTLVLSRYYSRRDSLNSCYRKLKRPKKADRITKKSITINAKSSRIQH